MTIAEPPPLVDPHPELGVWPPPGAVRARPARGLVVETDAGGAPVFLDDMDADRLLELAAESEQQARAAERRKLRYAYQWCVLHPPPDPGAEDAATWSEADPAAGGDAPLGGDGTPAVATGAAAELGAALGTTTAAAMQLMADAVNLKHRHPRTWARLEALEVPPWRARRLAQATAHTSLEAAREVDRRLADVIGSCGTRRIEATIADVLARLDPDAHEQAEQTAEDQWGVQLAHGTGILYDGTSTLQVTGDTVDLTAFHDLLCAVAHQLLDPQVPGSGPADLEQRRARALGVIADRAFAGVPVLDPDPPVRPAARTRLYLHLHAADLPDLAASNDAGTPVGTLEALGPATLTRLRAWLGGTHATILPVLHLDRTDPVDAHDPPAWMRELVTQRDPTCVFPWCQTSARTADLDHITPYDPDGPPGQTHPDNLAPLCRRHHRHKTHGHWRYTRDPDGTYTWHSPRGHTYLVSHGTTHAISPA